MTKDFVKPKKWEVSQEYSEQIKKFIDEKTKEHPDFMKINSCAIFYTDILPNRTYSVVLFPTNTSSYIDSRFIYEPKNDTVINFSSPYAYDIENGVSFNFMYGVMGPASYAPNHSEEGTFRPSFDYINHNELRLATGYLTYSSINVKQFPNFKGDTEDPIVDALIRELSKYFDLKDRFNPVPKPDQTPSNAEANNSGQFGGGGKPLKDIKLFLYANKVTKGTIKLSKPQVEVGTYATDWRPNPADATKSIEMMLKQIESVRKGGRKNGKKRD